MAKRLTDHERYLRTITEASWQDTVIECAERLGWILFYVPDRMWRRAFVSGIPMDLGQRGYPDITGVHLETGRLVFRELKPQNPARDLSDHQIKWRDALLLGGHDWKLWRPSDMDEVMEDFRSPTRLE